MRDEKKRQGYTVEMLRRFYLVISLELLSNVLFIMCLVIIAAKIIVNFDKIYDVGGFTKILIIGIVQLVARVITYCIRRCSNTVAFVMRL